MTANDTLPIAFGPAITIACMVVVLGLFFSASNLSYHRLDSPVTLLNMKFSRNRALDNLLYAPSRRFNFYVWAGMYYIFFYHVSVVYSYAIEW